MTTSLIETANTTDTLSHSKSSSSSNSIASTGADQMTSQLETASSTHGLASSSLSPSSSSSSANAIVNASSILNLSPLSSSSSSFGANVSSIDPAKLASVAAHLAPTSQADELSQHIDQNDQTKLLNVDTSILAAQSQDQHNIATTVPVIDNALLNSSTLKIVSPLPTHTNNNQTTEEQTNLQQQSSPSQSTTSIINGNETKPLTPSSTPNPLVSPQNAAQNASTTPTTNATTTATNVASPVPKRLHVSNIPFRFRDPDLRAMFGVSINHLV